MFEYIPDRFKPVLGDHSDCLGVYRLVIHTDNLTFEDFVPSYLEEGYTLKGIQSDYSVSVWRKKSVLLKQRQKFDVLKKYNGLAIGDTSNFRGVSFGKIHVDYFLFDYLNNSPCEDFSICEVF